MGLFCLMSVYGLSQNYYDDLYYIPDSDDEISENIESDDSQTVETEDSRDAVTETGADVDYDSSGMAVDVDAYNRRYDADDTRTVAAAAETGSGTDVSASASSSSFRPASRQTSASVWGALRANIPTRSTDTKRIN